MRFSTVIVPLALLFSSVSAVPILYKRGGDSFTPDLHPREPVPAPVAMPMPIVAHPAVTYITRELDDEPALAKRDMSVLEKRRSYQVNDIKKRNIAPRPVWSRK
ncbi:hypothetical protein C8Q75DRAFT_811272 [Abortiporus biennis]|nr:hypothetical protein C8Q75DRAFT_811272 [Abortiporus biennis]